MDKLHEAIEDLKDRLELENGFSFQKENTYGYFSAEGFERNDNQDYARLRLDWELVDELTADDDKIKDLMLLCIEEDLEDLLENGDVNNVSDALLKSMNGSKVRGKEVTEVDIFSAHLYFEHKEKKESTEYTLYILMYVRWE